MSFIIDRQTQDDLRIFGQGGRDGIYQLFQQTRTRGGAELMEGMFRYPLSDARSINLRSEAIRKLHEGGLSLPFEAAWLDAAEQYLENQDERSRLRSDGDTVARKLNQLIGADTQYQGIVTGLSALWDIMQSLRSFLAALRKQDCGELLQSEVKRIAVILGEEALTAFLKAPLSRSDYNTIAHYDQLIRFRQREAMQQLLRHCYQLDVYFSVGAVAAAHGFSYAVALDKTERRLRLRGFYHPQVKGAVANDLDITAGKPVVFLTGANMAGKSTLMKAAGIAVYLAHAGFPVPAASMEFSVQDGLLTSINLADNLQMGYSHFFAEVLRVKQVAEHLAHGRQLFVIFDELFRGTNVKDAFDATVAITTAYGQRPNIQFIVSTHIIEAAGTLQQQCSSIQYLYLPTVMEGSTPTYTYRLAPGVTADRHGLMILQNEQIPAILANGARKSAAPDAAAFITDAQTLQDLNLTGKYKHRSIFSLFNQTVTAGGEQLLETYFRQPLTDPAAINERSAVISWFGQQAFRFPIEAAQYTGLVNYVRIARAGKPSILFQSLLRRSRFLIGVKEEYLAAMEGLKYTLQSLAMLRVFLREGWQLAPAALQVKRNRIWELLNHPGLALGKAAIQPDALSWQQALQYEFLFRGALYEGIKELIAFLHELDVYIAVGNTAHEKGFTRAVAYPKEKHTLVLHEMWHPALEKAVPNNLFLNNCQHFLFLTGANMAGKSTFMKTMGVCFYLAHMGFPVPARHMDFSVMEGMYTSINVPDNIDKGYSHFYAEVMRVKKVVEGVAAGRSLLVIFDELFKGTNVKDAYDATLLVSEAMMAYTRCLFVISTHITEVGQALQEKSYPIQYRFMPTVLLDGQPNYPYRLKEGISDDRHGMLLIQQEGVLDMLQKAARS